MLNSSAVKINELKLMKYITNKYWNTAKSGQKKLKLKLPGAAMQESSNRAGCSWGMP